MTPHKDFFLASGPSVPTPLLPPSPVLSDALQVYHPHAAGIDIGEAEPWAAVPRGAPPNPCPVSAPSPPPSPPSPTGSSPVASPPSPWSPPGSTGFPCSNCQRLSENLSALSQRDQAASLRS
jgi:hypothetical protein